MAELERPVDFRVNNNMYYELTPIKYADEDGKLLINDGEFFGMLIDKNCLAGLFPDIITYDNLTYSYYVDGVEEIPEYEKEFAVDVAKGKKPESEMQTEGKFPLIMKKLEGNLALDLISGVTVEIDDVDKICNMQSKPLTPKEYDDFIKHYEPRGYIISNINEDGTSNCYLVNDSFKEAFAEYYKDDIKRVAISNYLKNLTKAMSEKFNEIVKKNVDLVHGIANVDNMIYDAGGRNL